MLTGEDIKVGQRFRRKTAPELVVTLIAFEPFGVRYRREPGEPETSAWMSEFLRDWELIDAAT